MGLFNRDQRWAFVFEDWKWMDFPVWDLEAKVAFFTMDEDACCDLVDSKGMQQKIEYNENIFS